MRTLMDDSFRTWEAYATTGDFGFSRPARIVFRCITEPDRRARAVFVDGDRSDAEARVQGFTDGELKALLAEAEPVD